MKRTPLVIIVIIAGAAAGLAAALFPDPSTGRPAVQGGMPSLRDDALRVEIVAEGTPSHDGNLCILSFQDSRIYSLMQG